MLENFRRILPHQFFLDEEGFLISLAVGGNKLYLLMREEMVEKPPTEISIADDKYRLVSDTYWPQWLEVVSFDEMDIQLLTEAGEGDDGRISVSFGGKYPSDPMQFTL